MKRIKYMERCFEHANDPDFMDYCFYICDQYSFTSLSTFFDGDIDFLKKISFLLLSFIRKVKNNEPLIQTNIPESRDINSVDFNDPKYSKLKKPLKLFFPDDEPEKPEEPEEVPSKYEYKPFIEVDENVEEDEEIYENKKTSMIFDRFIPKFVNNHKALNPFKLNLSVNFDIDIQNLIKNQCDLDEQDDVLDRNVMKEYFSITADDLHEFSNDLFLPFADYDYFAIEEKKKNDMLKEVGIKPKPDYEKIAKEKEDEFVNEIQPYLGDPEDDIEEEGKK
jgi:hypothetical protein